MSLLLQCVYTILDCHLCVYCVSIYFALGHNKEKEEEKEEIYQIYQIYQNMYP